MDRRSQRTRQRLAAAMLTLIQTQLFSDIRIEDVIMEADVARKTFYTHFTSKQDLLWHSLEQHFTSIIAQSNDLDPETLLMDGKPLSYPVFEHVRAFPLLYKSLLLEDGDGEIILRLWRYLAAQSYAKHRSLRSTAPQAPDLPPELIAELLVGALLGAVRWWLRTDLQATPTEMAYRFSQLVAPGVLQALGHDNL